MINKTNAARILDTLGMNYELISYTVDESDLSAVSVAEKLGENINQIFKTLVLRGDKTGIFITVIPGKEEVDLKKAAKVSGNKKAEMIQMKELFPVTGYIRGGCSPIGMKKNYPVFIDENILLFDQIFVSAGQRGVQLKIKPDDLIKSAKAKTSDLIFKSEI